MQLHYKYSLSVNSFFKLKEFIMANVFKVNVYQINQTEITGTPKVMALPTAGITIESVPTTVAALKSGVRVYSEITVPGSNRTNQGGGTVYYVVETIDQLVPIINA
jgi:hypothetical protein